MYFPVSLITNESFFFLEKLNCTNLTPSPFVACSTKLLYATWTQMCFSGFSETKNWNCFSLVTCHIGVELQCVFFCNLAFLVIWCERFSPFVFCVFSSFLQGWTIDLNTSIAPHLVWPWRQVAVTTSQVTLTSTREDPPSLECTCGRSSSYKEVSAQHSSTGLSSLTSLVSPPDLLTPVLIYLTWTLVSLSTIFVIV